MVVVVFLVAALMTWLFHRHGNQFGPTGNLLGRPHYVRVSVPQVSRASR